MGGGGLSSLACLFRELILNQSFLNAVMQPFSLISSIVSYLISVVIYLASKVLCLFCKICIALNSQWINEIDFEVKNIISSYTNCLGQLQW